LRKPPGAFVLLEPVLDLNGAVVRPRARPPALPPARGRVWQRTFRSVKWGPVGLTFWPGQWGQVDVR